MSIYLSKISVGRSLHGPELRSASLSGSGGSTLWLRLQHSRPDGCW